MMDMQPPLPGESRSHQGGLAGAITNTEILGTQRERSHQLVHRDAANAATKLMMQNAHLHIVRNTGSSKNEMQHAV